MSYMQEVRTLVPIDVSPEALVTLGQAAEILGVSIQAVAGRVDRGKYATVIVDTEVTEGWGVRGRRLLLRVEVMERALAG